MTYIFALSDAFFPKDFFAKIAEKKKYQNAIFASQNPVFSNLDF